MRHDTNDIYPASQQLRDEKAKEWRENAIVPMECAIKHLTDVSEYVAGYSGYAAESHDLLHLAERVEELLNDLTEGNHAALH